jgi:hypothetical protein
MRTEMITLLSAGLVCFVAVSGAQAHNPSDDYVREVILESDREKLELEWKLKVLDLAVKDVVSFQGKMSNGRDVDDKIDESLKNAAAAISSAAANREIDNLKERINAMQLAIIEAMRLAPGQQ